MNDEAQRATEGSLVRPAENQGVMNEDHSSFFIPHFFYYPKSYRTFKTMRAMRRILIVSVIILTASLVNIENLVAAPGDTTIVSTHNEAHWNWYGARDSLVTFDSEKTYQKIILRYTLGCPTSGCSEWDYTTAIYAMKQMDMDSAGNPIYERFELTRIITPYNGGVQYGWFHTWEFDVTDFSSILEGETLIRAMYGGWQNGFTISLDFLFIEGTPARDAKRVINVASSGIGGFKYGFIDDPIDDRLGPLTIDIEEGEETVKTRFSATGHSFGGNQNCAEFCQKSYYLYVNGTSEFTNSIWREDCGSVSIPAQGGTWIYNRAGWCPGGPVKLFEHDITEFTAGENQVTLDMILDPYTYTGGASVDPKYIIEWQMVTYGAPNFQWDVAIDEILSPSNKDEYARESISCSAPVIRVRNTGANPISTFVIKYGGNDTQPCYYRWEGDPIAFDETVVVTLPLTNWWGLDQDNPKFYAEVFDPGWHADEYPHNNYMETAITIPEVMPTTFNLKVKTNSDPAKTAYFLYSDEGDTLISAPGGLSTNTIYENVIDLAEGCYTFHITDEWVGNQGDGLSWWANTAQGNGFVRIEDLNGGILKSFNSDFGTEILYHFTAGTPMGQYNTIRDCTDNITDVEQIINPNSSFDFGLHPNPGSGLFELSLWSDELRDIDIKIVDLMGHEVSMLSSTVHKDHIMTIDLMDQADGIYMIILESEGELRTEKIQVIR